MTKRNYYEVLGVTSRVDSDQLKKAYRKLAAQYHPDKAGGNEEKFKELNNAYKVLSDPQKRQEYDTLGDTIEELAKQRRRDNAAKQAKKAADKESAAQESERRAAEAHAARERTAREKQHNTTQGANRKKFTPESGNASTDSRWASSPDDGPAVSRYKQERRKTDANKWQNFRAI